MLTTVSIILNVITIIIFIVTLGLVLKERKIHETKRDVVCNRVTEIDAGEQISSIREEPLKDTIYNYVKETQNKLRSYIPTDNTTQA